MHLLNTVKIPGFILSTILLLSACESKTTPAEQKGDAKVQPTDTATAATASVFSWNTELCENKGKFDPQQYTPEQLHNAYDLWFTYSGVALETDGTVFQPEDIVKLDSVKLREEYEGKKSVLEAMKTVDRPYWQKLKQQRLRELEDEYELKKIAIEAYTRPEVLLNNRFAKPCGEYAQALASADTARLFGAWKALAEKQKAQNGSPEQFMERFYEKFRSDNRLEYAKVDLITFGWWNCANGTLTHVDRDEQMETEFRQLFTDIQSECDEP
jgi:hypothetical protein